MLILLPYIFVNSVTISDVVRKDTNFYYRQFQTYPSKLATLEYSMKFNITKINHQCSIGNCNVFFDVYTTEHDKNVKTNCSNDSFGQLRNENLCVPLRPRYKPYRSTSCKLDDVHSDMIHCKGKTTIQDYKARHYGFSFGYKSDASVKPPLAGFWYNFTISRQSNKTQCLPFPHHISGIMKECTVFYNHMSLPNMIGNHHINPQNIHTSVFEVYAAIDLILYISSQLPTGGCHKYLKELLCRIIFPECDQTQNHVIHICKETCSEFLSSCLRPFQTFLLSSHFSQLEEWSKIMYANIFDEMDCNYLPSVDDKISCYYKPVTCNSPPNVTNARIIDGIMLKLCLCLRMFKRNISDGREQHSDLSVQWKVVQNTKV